MSPLVFYDDFTGPISQTIPASASPGSNFVKKLVGAGPSTVGPVANAAGGQVACALTSSSNLQEATLYWDDAKYLDVTKGLVFEARFQLSVLPNAASVQAVVGLASNWIDGPDNNTFYLQIGAAANGALLVRSKDGVNTISAAAGLHALRSRLHRSRTENPATPRQPLRHKVVTHILGTFRYLYLRSGHRLRAGGNRIRTLGPRKRRSCQGGSDDLSFF
jgi:hypothetical protein